VMEAGGLAEGLGPGAAEQPRSSRPSAMVIASADADLAGRHRLKDARTMVVAKGTDDGCNIGLAGGTFHHSAVVSRRSDDDLAVVGSQDPP
jgi:hypothetical protein